MRENMRLAFQGIWLHKMRSFLTMLGIVIGIAAIIAIVSTIKGTNEQIKEALVGSGNNVVEVTLSQDGETIEGNNEEAAVVPLVSEETLSSIRADQYVQDVATYNSRSFSDGVNYQGKALSGATVYGVSENYISLCGYEISSGRGFRTGDYKGFQKVVLIDENTVYNLFTNEDPIGKTLEIQGEPFVVIGVVVPKHKREITINTFDEYYTYYGETYGKVFMPKSVWPVVYRFDEPEHVAVRAVDTDHMTNAGKAASDVLNNTFSHKTISYVASDTMETVRSLQELSEGTNKQLIWIASISLLVGGIGVMNIMLVSVTERTREIGLKKAIGAKKRSILMQFLTEAAVLGSLGGLIGVLAGVILAYVISGMSGAPVAISAPAALLAVAFSMVIGIVFGLLPSVKAANLNPIEALRRE